MEYIIVSEHDAETFIKSVNERLKEGWKPQGGISHIKVVHPDSNELFKRDEFDSRIKQAILFMQPMIKEN